MSMWLAPPSHGGRCFATPPIEHKSRRSVGGVLSYSIVGCIYVTAFVIYVETKGMFLRRDTSFGPRIIPDDSLRTCTSL